MFTNMMITREQVEELFADLRAEDIDPEGEHLWCFNFLSESADDLETLAAELGSDDFGANPVEYSEEQGGYWLVACTEDSLSVEVLQELNMVFFQMAERFDVAYDGFDVDPS
ncbi:MAG: ribonuclease E inhibitor RraB [Myxococcota bacterium]